MSELLDFLLQLLSQFAGGPGMMENNLVRFMIPAILWGGLLYIAWARQREKDLPREKLLVWGFGLGLVSALLMAGFASLQILEVIDRQATYGYLVPVDRALAMASIIVVAGAFLRYILDDSRLARIYLQVGLSITVLCLGVALWFWPRYLAELTEANFHTTWAAWLFEVFLSILIVVAIILLFRKVGWLSRVVTIALLFFLTSEILSMVNYATDKSLNHIICPIGNSLRILAIPILGYVYLREQAIDKKRAEADLEAYRLHLEELVAHRTAELTSLNAQLTHEISERKLAEEALERLNRRYGLILESAGEGICGIDHEGKFSFVNLAAARVLGYDVDELVGQYCHSVWHHSTADDSPYPEEKCPIRASYTDGIPSRGDDQLFWRKDRTSFPILYVSSPTYDNGKLTGAVVVFRDITELKQAEAEIAQRNANLAAQNTIAAILSHSLELETILDTALDEVLSVVEMDIGLVFLQDSTTQELVLRSRRGEILDEDAKRSDQNWRCCMQISREAINLGRAVVHPSADYLCDYPESNIQRQGLEMLVSVPLASKNIALGALTLGSRQTNPVEQSTLDLLIAIGQQIGMAVENVRLYQESERVAKELTLLHQMSIVLTSTLNSARIYDQIAEQSVKLLNCQAACILAWNADLQMISLVASFGMVEAEVAFLQSSIDTHQHLHELIGTQKTVAINDAKKNPRVPAIFVEQYLLRALLCVPMRGMEESLGTLFLFDRKGIRNWRSDELELIESFVNRAAVALMNADLCKQLEWTAALEERQRIAADMHDGLAQTVSLLGLQIEGVTELIESNKAEQAVIELSNMREVVGQASVDVRRSIASLQGAPQPPRSIQDMLYELPEQLSVGDEAAIELDFKVQEPLFIPLEQRSQALLIVQEALVNAQRHAQAKRIRLLLEGGEHEVTITVEDDGIGFDPSKWWENSQDHFGLGIIHARAARIGGRLKIDSAPGMGTRVSMTLPMVSNICHSQFGALQTEAPGQNLFDMGTTI